MYESINIIYQILSNLIHLSSLKKKNHFLYFFTFFNFLKPKQFSYIQRTSAHTSMETLIRHFKFFSEGLLVPKGFAYKAVEAPKGEFGTAIISDGSSIPYRCKIRTPAYHHMQVMPRMVQGHYFADLVTVLGSVDIVFGDVDR